MHSFFMAMHYRKPTHPYNLGIYATATEFTEVGAKYRSRFFRCLIACFVLGVIPVIFKIAFSIF